MSLELKIEALTTALTALTAQLQAGNVAAPAPVVQAVPAPVAAAPVAAPAPVAAIPIMITPPTFMAPSLTTTGAPFSDPKGLIDYVMGVYKALGPQKGALIQGVLTKLGYQNINDVKTEHYAALHTNVEALKG
jgi:hypothetical protein